MIHIRTRNELMSWLEDNAPRPGIARAMQNGRTELLGVFRRIPPDCDMGWIVEVESIHGTIWHVAIKPHKFTHNYWCHMVSEIPWKGWMGDVPDGRITPGTPLYAGDNPDIYQEMKYYETKK